MRTGNNYFFRIMDNIMIEYEEIKKTITQKIIKKTICDKCKKEIIKDDYYDIYDPEIKIRFGDYYPEGGAGYYYKAEICKKCIKRMIKLIIENGYEFRKEEWDT